MKRQSSSLSVRQLIVTLSMICCHRLRQCLRLCEQCGNFEPFFQEVAAVDGKVMACPSSVARALCSIIPDMFAAAGLDGPPKTMAEYSEYAKLTQRDASGNPTVSGWSLRLSGGGGGIAEKFWINLHQFGGSLLEKAGDGYKASYANDAGLAALRQYVEAVSGDKTVTVEMPADSAAFQREQTAMFIRESWVIGDTAKKAPNLNYKTALLPRGSIALPVNLYVAGGSRRRRKQPGNSPSRPTSRNI